LGDEPSAWRWGDLHPLCLDHPLGAVPGLGRQLSRGPYPNGGDVNTVNQGGYSVHDGPQSLGFVPAYRQVIDLADFDRSTFQLPAGNSGIPGHPRYDDCIEEYRAGRSRPLLYSPAAIEEAAEHRLTLLPSGERRDA
jgi:penicillin amidase